MDDPNPNHNSNLDNSKTYEQRKLYYRNYYQKNRERILKLRAKQVSKRCNCKCTCSSRKTAELVAAPISNTSVELNGKRVITIVKKRKRKKSRCHNHKHSAKNPSDSSIFVAKHTGMFSFKKMFEC